MLNLRTHIFLFLSLFLSSAVNAQYFTLGVQTGFGIGTSNETYGYYSTLRYSNAWGHVVDELGAVTKSLGHGVPVDVEIGYVGGIGLAFGISGGYQHGLATSIDHSAVYYDTEDVRKDTYQGHYYHISPYLGLYRRWKKWGFTVRAYPVFAFVSFRRQADIQLRDESNGTDGDKLLYIREFKGPITVGFKGSFDVEHVFKSGKQALFIGLSYTHLSFSPTSSEVTTHERNNMDELASLDPVDRSTEYSNSHSITYDFNLDNTINWNQAEDKPYKAYRFNVPFDNLAINLGVRFYFGRNPKAVEE